MLTAQFNPLTAAIRGSAYKLFVKWRRYPGARLERYLQEMAPLSGWPALQIGPLSKTRIKIFVFL